MWTIIFLGTTIIFAIGWLKWKISAFALSYYIVKKQYIPPNDEDMKECTEYAAKNLFKDLIGHSQKR